MPSDDPLKEQNALIMQGVRWAINSAEEVFRAGGSASAFLSDMPDRVVTSMVRNSLSIKYDKGSQ